jgi:hypothetical protein
MSEQKKIMRMMNDIIPFSIDVKRKIRKHYQQFYENKQTTTFKFLERYKNQSTLKMKHIASVALCLWKKLKL